GRNQSLESRGARRDHSSDDAFMKLLVAIGGREQVVDTTTLSDIVEVEPGVYSIVREGRSSEVRVTPAADGSLEVHLNGRTYSVVVRDPRRRSRHRGGVAVEGRQDIIAP